MLTQKPSFKKWISLLAVIGFLVFILYFLFFTDLRQVAVVIEGISIPIYLLSFASVIGVALFSALTWKATLDVVGTKTTFRRVFNLNWVGIFVDSLIPGGLAGDLFMTYLLSKDEGVDGAKVLASVIIKDVLELIVILGSLIVGMVLLVLNYSVNSLLLIAIGTTLAFLALPLFLIIYLSTNVSATKKLLRALVGAIAKIRKKPFETAQLENKITDFHDGIMSIKNNPKAMMKPIVFQTVAWIFEILALYFVFVALGSQIAADKILITNTVVSTIRDQGVVLAGFSQIISSQLYGVLGINLSLSQASSLLAGLANFWFRLVVSFVFFQLYGLGTIAEKILNKAFKVKTKEDKKDFKKYTDINARDFEAKTESNKKDFEKLRESSETDFNEQRDSDRKDFDEKTETDKSDRMVQRDIHRKDFKEKTDSDKKDFEKLSDTNASDYKEHKDSAQKDFETKTDCDKSEYKDQKDTDKKDFKEKMVKHKKDFQNKKDSEEKTANDKKNSEK
jgi:glycosyltransferase 2 family protein